MQEFVGPKYEDYRQKWLKLSQRKFKLSWNWAAFFFSIYWFAYRKMYGWAMFYSLVYVAYLTWLEYRYGSASSLSLLNASTLVMWGSGISGNDLYLRHVKRKLSQIAATVPTGGWKAAAVKRGGTSWWAVVAALVVCCALAFAAEVLVPTKDSPTSQPRVIR